MYLENEFLLFKGIFLIYRYSLFLITDNTVEIQKALMIYLDQDTFFTEESK